MHIGRVAMRKSHLLAASIAMLLVAVAATPSRVTARQASTMVSIDADDIGGVVTSAKGPEAGVWVIAQTKDLPTKFIKIVVTDDRGRYLLPDLPKANYEIWVRGYGLVDSTKVWSTPGKTLNLRAVIAPTPKAAAQYYPASYWYALLEPPPPSDFPGTGPRGNGISDTQRSQGEWIGNIKETNACTQCHQMGNRATREILPQLGTFKDSIEAWDHRVQVGISGSYMSSTMGRLGRSRALRVFADWSDRIAKGEIPPAAPPRPAGVERNIVISQWEWISPELFVHDEITTDRRNPTVNANGPVYGVTEMSGNFLTILDPVKHTDRKIPIAPPNANSKREVAVPSPYWGDEVIWKGGGPHNPWMDSKGRVWMTAGGGCRMYDPKTDKIIQITECRGGHHLQMDDNEVLWFDGGGSNAFDIKAWEAGKGPAAMTMYPVVIDTNGNGKLDQGYVDAKTASVDPTRDKAMNYGQSYTSVPSPSDGSVWTSYSVIPGGMVRLDPKTGLYEYFQVPYMHPGATKMVADAYLPHGIDVDRGTGVIWMALNSGHFAEFDRRKCKGPLNGPGSETGEHCVEGWTMHVMPGPNFKGVERSGTSDAYYLNWTDWHNSSGFGDNTPLANGSNADALYAYVNGKFVTMRVPYPMGFATRGMDGRIDDPNGGWKGRAIWTTHAGQATWHQEGGKSERPKAIKFQIRPNPLAK